jgi:two-component system sensor histidine kinase KdpD
VLALPLVASQGKVGVLAIKPHGQQSTMTAAQLLLLETFTNQLALAIERGRLIRQSQQAQVEAESERLRSALLSSVSHDLRTPLAGITGAASTLLEDRARLGDAQTQELLQSIYSESRRLNDLIDNLIFATKLEAGKVQLRRDWVALEEVIGSAVGRVRGRLGNRSLKITVPAELPLVRADGVLIEQVLINILENAIKHTPQSTPIEIAAWTTDDAVVTEVADEGPGLPPGEERRVFDHFYRSRTLPGVTGLGLGLTICRGIVRAHGGRIWAENHQPHGASFRFSLPREQQPAMTDQEHEIGKPASTSNDASRSHSDLPTPAHGRR